jgi:membrane protein DedA with SNARE-associated domain
MDLLTMDIGDAQTICCTFIGAFLGCVAGYYISRWRE